MALSTWSTPDKSLMLSIAAGAIREHFPQAIVPGAPMWFDFGPAGVLDKTLTDAGFGNIALERHVFVQEMRDGEEYWEAVVGISGRLQMLMANIPAETAVRIKANAVGAAESFRAGKVIKIPCEELLAWAVK